MCDSLFNIFKKDIQIELVRHAVVVWDDETRESYYTLMVNCPVESIIGYAQDSIAAVRCLIFSGLANKNGDERVLYEILSKHKFDTATYLGSPTDVVVEYRVNEYMQKVINAKVDKKFSEPNYNSRLEEIKSRHRIIIPGEHHGIVAKDFLVKLDSLSFSKNGVKILSFTLHNGVESVKANNVFTESVRTFINNLRPGDSLFIEEIIFIEADRRGRLPSIVLELR
jgi:hypothetical protein